MILASHIFWGTWAVVQSKNSTIKFNFVKYSILRYCAYFKHLVLMGKKIDNLNFFLHLLRYLLTCKSISFVKSLQLILVS